MADQDNIRVARETFEAWNAHDVERFVKLLAPSTEWSSDAFPAPFKGHDGARQFFQVYVGGFPDLHLDIEDVFASGDRVVIRWRSSGTHRGDLGGLKPTNRRSELHGCTVSEIKADKIHRSWVYFDNATMLRQLGALPA
jgi:steroid delta-isomerase-like uncharacterized protein